MAREILDAWRARIAAGAAFAGDPSQLAQEVLAALSAEHPSLRRLLNATGILLHTGLGRAPLAPEALAAVQEIAAGYSNLEFDLATGQRGKRTTGVTALLTRLTGAPAATVVNNNAAATLLALRALASGKEVIVSRGQLVEIGGSYRLPEVFEASGARLREVGTTNKTRLSDYDRAIGPDTAALLRVHTSNYRIVGFTEDVPLADLARLAHDRGLFCIDDLGSGALCPGSPPLPADEPTVSESLAAGADLVLFSGDKLLGGPQCGLVLGKTEILSRLEADPLMRALRVDKLTLAALEATLRLALHPDLARRRIPLWSFLSLDPSTLNARAQALACSLRADPGLSCQVVPAESYLGGGSLPMSPLPSFCVRIAPPFPRAELSVQTLSQALRASNPPVIARIHQNALWIDPRTLFPSDDAELLDVFRALFRPS